MKKKKKQIDLGEHDRGTKEGRLKEIGKHAMGTQDRGERHGESGIKKRYRRQLGQRETPQEAYLSMCMCMSDHIDMKREKGVCYFPKSDKVVKVIYIQQRVTCSRTT